MRVSRAPRSVRGASGARFTRLLVPRPRCVRTHTSKIAQSCLAERPERSFFNPPVSQARSRIGNVVAGSVIWCTRSPLRLMRSLRIAAVPAHVAASASRGAPSPSASTSGPVCRLAAPSKARPNCPCRYTSKGSGNEAAFGTGTRYVTACHARPSSSRRSKGTGSYPSSSMRE